MQTSQGALIDKFLTTQSNGLFPDGFIAEQVLPALPVFQTTGKLSGYGNNHLRIVNTHHKGKGDYRQLESITVNDSSYSIEDHGLYDIITDNDMRNYERPYDADKDTMLALSLAHQIAKEYGLATTLQNPAIITQGTTLVGNAQYSNIDHSDSDPLADKIVADNAIEAATGVASNTAIMSSTTFRYMSRHAKILGAYGFTATPKMGLNSQQLASVLQVDRVLIGSAQYNASVEGQADDLQNIWGKDVIYANIKAPALRQKTLGFEMRKKGTKPRQVFRYNPVMPVKSRGVIVTDNYDQFIVEPLCAYLIQDAVE